MHGKTAGLCTLILSLLVIAAALAVWWGVQDFKSPGPLTQTAIIDVPRGSGMRNIAHLLEESGVVRSAFLFAIATRLEDAQADLKAGEYEFPAHISAREALEKLRRGDVVIRRYTIPEGLTSYQIAALLRGIEGLSGELPSTPPPEGSLLPGTYDYERGQTRAAAVERLQGEMQKTLSSLWEARRAELPLRTPQEALTLASIVEKETGLPAERARIAGVFINRLKAGMPLQSDPTVIYALTKGVPENEGLGPLGRRLLKKDLDIGSPYNTYKYPGLPPGPIANPGVDSIKATLQPEMHDFLYFVADGSGGHVFAQSLDAHNKNVIEWRKKRRAQSP